MLTEQEKLVVFSPYRATSEEIVGVMEKLSRRDLWNQLEQSLERTNFLIVALYREASSRSLYIPPLFAAIFRTIEPMS